MAFASPVSSFIIYHSKFKIVNNLLLHKKTAQKAVSYHYSNDELFTANNRFTATATEY